MCNAETGTGTSSNWRKKGEKRTLIVENRNEVKGKKHKMRMIWDQLKRNVNNNWSNLLWCVCRLLWSHPFSHPENTESKLNKCRITAAFYDNKSLNAIIRLIRHDNIWLSQVCLQIKVQSHRALDVRVFLRRTQVLLPLPLPHGFQVVRVKGGDPSSCWYLLHPDTSPEVQGGHIITMYSASLFYIILPTSFSPYTLINHRAEAVRVLIAFN